MHSHTCNIFLQLQCNFTENKAINVMQDQPGLAKLGISLNLMHQSIPSTNIPPGRPPGNFVKVVKFPAPGQKIFAKLRTRGKKIDKNPAPGDNFVDLQDNFAMIVKPFAFFWYSSLAWLSSSFSKIINLRIQNFSVIAA